MSTRPKLKLELDLDTEATLPISTRIINSLEKEFCENDDIACIYVYFQDGEDQPTSTDIFISLLKQLLRQQKHAIAAEGLKTKYQDWCDQKILPNKATTGEYLDLFKAQVATFETVYLVVDAFDNCQNSSVERTQDKLQEAIEQLPNNIRVLVTSRLSWDARWVLKSWQALLVTPHDDDIEVYLNSRIKHDRAMQQKIKEASDPNFQRTIISEITMATRGM